MLALWTLAGAAALYLIIKYMTGKKHKLPPGPPGQLFIGNLLQLDKDFPHKTMTKWSEKYGDIFSMTLLGRTTIVLNSFETIYEGLVTQANNYAGRLQSYRQATLLSNCPNIISNTFSPKWLYTKKMTMQTLRMYGDNLELLEEITLKLIADMLEELKTEGQKGPLDIYPIYHRCTTGIISSILYGYKVEKQKVDTILKVTEEGMVLFLPTGMGVILDIMPWLKVFPLEINKKLHTLRDSVKHWFSTELKERKAKREPGNPECVMDGLFDHQQKSVDKAAPMQLTDDEIYGINFNLIFAGTFTTSTTLNCLIAVLVNKPEIQKHMAKLIEAELGGRPPRLADRKTLHYIEAAILEILRYSSIITMNVPHSTMTDTTIKGYDIPKGTEVLFNLWKLHHSDEYWDEPWEFKPERYLDENGEVVPPDHINRKRLLAFGASRRVCIGETLAKNRLFLMVTSLLQHFEFLPAGLTEHPRHDPRDYKASFGIDPHRYRIKLVAKQ